jgi:lysophospholipase L1-like esterase
MSATTKQMRMVGGSDGRPSYHQRFFAGIEGLYGCSGFTEGIRRSYPFLGMTSRATTTLFRTSAVLAISVLVGCAPMGTDDTGTGGSAPAGAAGTSGDAGSTGAGGTTGGGGTSGVAGNTGAGGDTGAGGSTGGSTAGSLGTGVAGATGAGGATGGGGGGSGGATGGAGSSGSGGSGGSSAGGGGAGRGGGGGSAAGRGGAGGAGGGGAGGAGGSGGGSGGAGAYNPCPTNGDPCKVLPFGDSITDGIGSPSPGGGYRVDLFSRAVMAGKKLTFVGQSMNGPTTVAGMPFPRRHAGFSGYTIAQITAANIFDPAINMAPHIVLLHIGTNDMYMSPAGAPDRLAALVDKLTTMAPNALIVVSKIIPLSSGMSQVNTYNNAITPLIQQRITAGKHVIFVDQNTGFPTSELGDGVHPNGAGYVRMAGVWYAAIDDFLP